MKVVVPLVFLILGVWTVHLLWSWAVSSGNGAVPTAAWIDLSGFDGTAIVASADGAPFILRLEPHGRSSDPVGAPIQDAALRIRVEQGGSSFEADRSLTTVAYTAQGRMVFHLWNRRYGDRFSGTAPVTVRVMSRSGDFSETTLSIHPVD
jgi:hypothetical protein